MFDLTERRAVTYQHLLDTMGGDERAALEIQNAIDQIGIEDPVQRIDVLEAVVGSIERGQEWATGETTLKIRTCPVCEGAKRSRSGRGKCRACNGTGRSQVKCRACAEGVKPHQSMCVFCRGKRQLDPIDDRETILNQHREWWERVTKMTKHVENRPITEGPLFGTWRPKRGDVVELLVDGLWTKAEFHGYSGTSATAVTVVGPDGYQDVDPALIRPLRYRDDTHAGPPERPTALRGSVDRHYGGISMFWDKTIGSDETGIGTLEKPYATFAKAEEMAELAASMATKVGPEDDIVDRPQLPPTSPMPRTIAIALFRAQQAIRKVPKLAENGDDGYSYTSAEAIIEEARQALHGAGLCVTLFDWHTRGTDAMLTFLYVHESGEQYIAKPVPMPIVEDGGRDKRAPDKALATAMTYCESQYLRILLQIPRIGTAEDADARVDSGRARARKQPDADRPFLSTELNDTVVALYGAIEKAKDAKALAGVLARLEKATDLPEAVVTKIREAVTKKQTGLTGEGDAK